MAKITLLDGAVGTSLWEKADAAGVSRDPVWIYNMEHPEFVEALAREYAEAGSKIILANTFSANEPSVRRSRYAARDVVREGVRLVKDALKGTGAQTALAIGPLPMLLEPYGDMEEDECRAFFAAQMEAGMLEGPDLIMIQTFMDLEMMKIALQEAKKFGVPVFCTMSFERKGKTMMGNSVAQAVEALAPLGADALGLNCSLGPELALPIIREFAEKTDLPLVFKPNAGKPILQADGTTATVFSAEDFARDVAPALEYVRYVGGCCGSNPSYVRELKKLL